MEPHPDPTGVRLGRYRLVRELGRGGQATVHEAVAEPDGARVAVKRLHPRALLNDPSALDRLRREAAAARAVVHPGVVRALDVGLADDGAPYVVFELVAGGRPITRAFHGRPALERVALVRDAARALGALHAAGLVHRDVTPANVLVDERGAVRVTDLGLAWAPGEASLTRTGDVLGTRAALAPELAREGTKGSTSPRVDVWGLGLLLFEALTGKPPPPRSAPDAPLPGPAELHPAVPAALDAVCRQALALRPEERFADGDALAAALEAAARSLVAGGQEWGAPGPNLSASGRLTSARLRSGSRLGRYLLGDRLGDGAMGEVWRARDLEADRDVAVKVLRSASGAVDSAAEGRRRRFLREQQAAARVRHHGVVAVHDAGETDGVSWLAMDLVEGEPLDARLRRGPLEVDEALSLGAACARALQALHEAGVLHRDIKPANILLDREGNPRLTDFGVAALEGADALTRTGQTIGTPLYMAPEQLSGEEVDARTDVYGLGAVLWEGLAGRAPWSAQTLLELAAVKSTLPERPSLARRTSSQPLSSTASGSGAERLRRAGAVGEARLSALADAVVLRALAPDREGRPASAGALADALEQALVGQGDVSLRRAPRALVALGLLVVLAVGGGLLALAGRAPTAGPITAAELTTLRRRVEAQLGHTRRLGACPPELAEALVGAAGSTTPGDDAAALRTWLGLLTLARGDVAAASSLAGPGDSAAQLALRGGLAAHTGDAAAALRDLDAAARAGLRPAELERWRARALARRGVERGEAAALLVRAASLRADPADAAAGALLEVACQAGLGKRAEAEAGLTHLDAPPAELRWDVAVLAAAELLEARGAPAARDALAQAARPSRPGLGREADLAGRALERLRRLTARGGTLLADDALELVADLELVRALAPELALPTALAQELLSCARVSVMGGHSLGITALVLALSDAYPADPVVQGEVAEGLFALRFTDSAFLSPADPALELRFLEAGQRAARVTRAMSRISAELIRLSALLNLGRLDEASRAVVDAGAALDAAVAERAFGAEVVRAPYLLLRALGSARRGDAEDALRSVDEATPLVLPKVAAFARLQVLRDAGRREELVAATLAHAAAQGGAADDAVSLGLLELTWTTLSDAGRWSELGAFLGRRLDAAAPDPYQLTRLRAVHALLEAGDVEGAARRAEPLGWADLPAQLRAGDPGARARIRAAVGR